MLRQTRCASARRNWGAPLGCFARSGEPRAARRIRAARDHPSRARSAPRALTAADGGGSQPCIDDSTVYARLGPLLFAAYRDCLKLKDEIALVATAATAIETRDMSSLERGAFGRAIM